MRRTVGGSERYAGVDRDIARRMGAVIWIVGVVLAIAVLPLAPPTAPLGDIGWGVAAADCLVAVAGAALLLRRPASSYGALLAGAYLGLGQIVLAQWLAGGLEAPYWQLFMLPVLHVSAIHPPRRLVPFMVVAIAAAAGPLAYDRWDSTAAGAFLLGMLLWLGIAFITFRLMHQVRAQRVKSQREEDHAQRLARLDALTGLSNRRAFDEAIAEQIADARVSGRPLSVLIADLDSFKAINDEWGHVNGDSCLRQVARTLHNSVRATDACFRWGGDEFAVLLPGADAERATELCNRIRTAVRDSCRGPDGAPLSVSCGHTQLSRDMDAQALVEAADLTLLQVKRSRGGAQHAGADHAAVPTALS
jgi:diguanylate cyclase (GGDEF)-like protein